MIGIDNRQSSDRQHTVMRDEPSVDTASGNPARARTQQARSPSGMARAHCPSAGKHIGSLWPYPLVRWFTVVLLLVAALGKLTSLLSDEGILPRLDPVIYWLSHRHLLTMVAIFEIGAVLILLRPFRPVFHLWFSSWIYTLFLLYRLGLWLFVGPGVSCHCLGHLTDRLGVSHQSIDRGLLYLVLVLLFLAILALWRSSERRRLSVGFHASSGLAPIIMLALSAGHPTYIQGANEVQPTMEISGQIEYRYFTNGDNAQADTHLFLVRLQPPRYALRLEFGEEPERIIRAVECTFDGTDCFRLEEINPHFSPSEYLAWDGDRLVTKPVTEVERLKNRATCTIVEGPFPPERDENMAALWVAFASHLVLTNANQMMVGPTLLPAGPWYQQHGIEMPFYWTRRPSSSSFLEACWQTHPGQRYIPDVANGVLYDQTKLLVRPLSGSLVSGYTNFTYSVSDWTNLGGVTLPARAGLECFYVSPRGPTTVVRYSQHSVHSIHVQTNLLPRLEPTTRDRVKVVEGRRRITGFSLPYVYFAENGKVMDRDGLAASRDYRLEQRMRGSKPVKHQSIAVLYYILFACTLFAPLAVIIERHITKQRRRAQ